MLLGELVGTSAAVAEAGSRLVKISRLAELLRRVTRAEVETAIAFLSGELRQGRIGIGPAVIPEARPSAASDSPAPQLLEVDAAFERISATTGRGSVDDLQESPHYPGGLALRFARVKSYRPTSERQKRIRSIPYAESTGSRPARSHPCVQA